MDPFEALTDAVYPPTPSSVIANRKYLKMSYLPKLSMHIHHICRSSRIAATAWLISSAVLKSFVNLKKVFCKTLKDLLTPDPPIHTFLEPVTAMHTPIHYHIYVRAIQSTVNPVIPSCPIPRFTRVVLLFPSTVILLMRL